jgi:hypothetical protein
MAESLKILAQSSPSATTLTDFYTVASLTTAVISSMVICNQNSTTITFRIKIAPGGVVDATAHAIYYDMPLLANDSYLITGGLVMASGDIMRIFSSDVNVSFTMFGSEVV